MYKGIVILYLVCFSLYIVYSREPDFIDGSTTMGIIHWQQDSILQERIPKAVFTVDRKEYAVDARYLFRHLPEGKQLEVIYNPAKPKQAAVYSWWGYMITLGEIIGSIVLLVALFQVAVAVNKNPSEESLKEQLEYTEVKKTKYD